LQRVEKSLFMLTPVLLNSRKVVDVGRHYMKNRFSRASGQMFFSKTRETKKPV
jgi:hypothetical protein